MSKVVSSEYEAQKRLIKDCLTKNLDYTYIGNLHDQLNRPVREDTLSDYLIDRGYPSSAVSKAVRELVVLTGDRTQSLYELNKQVYSLLRYGVSYHERVGEKDKRLHFIDWEHPELNRFEVAEEVSVLRTAGAQKKRPDIVIYVNGIAVAMFELKRSSIEATEGIRQLLTNQKKENIPGFFTTQQLLFAGNESQGLFYGAIETPEKFYLKWREDPKATDAVSQKIQNMLAGSSNPLQQGVIAMCQQERLLSLIHDFVIFDAGRKKLARHNQFFACMAARPFIEQRKGGIIWNTQGSGKSLIMAWLSQWIIEHIDDSRVVIITDRDELDKQIADLFGDIDQKIRRATSGQDLRDILSGKATKGHANDEPIVCSLIHKYGHNAGKDSDIEQYRRALLEDLPADYAVKGSVVAFIDEAHRTNSGKLHEAVRALMPDAPLIGFTGTPILQKDKKTTLEIFGPYIHTYKFDEGVRDNVVLDLRYEPRDIDQDLTSEAKIDQWFEAKTRGLTEVAKNKLKSSWSTLNKLYSSKDRLEKIVADILFDMETKPRLKSDRGTAMLVAGSIYEACKYWELFTSRGFTRCAVVTSYEPSDAAVRTATSDLDQEGEEEFKKRIYERMLGDETVEAFEERVKEQFKKEPAKMKLLIVVDKLLTGFDAPSASYLYIDKSMRDHDLFQAICRVNRPDDPSKDYGYIVDYMDLFRSVQMAFNDYTGDALEDYDRKDVEGLLKRRSSEAKAKMEGARKSLEQLLSEVEQPRDEAAHIRFFSGIPDGAEGIDEEARRRNMFYSLVSTYTRSFANCVDLLVSDFNYTEEELAQIREEIRDYNKLKDAVMLAVGDWIDLKPYQEDMRFILDTYVSAQDSTTIANFDETPLVELLLEGDSTTPVDVVIDPVIDDPTGKAEVIEGNLIREIIRKLPMNQTYYGKMSELLKQVIEERKLHASSYKEYLRQVAELARKIHCPEEAGDYPDEVRSSAARRALYDFLGEKADVAVALDDAIQTVREPGWLENHQKQQRIRRAIYSVLSKHGYTEDEAEEATESIFELAMRQDEYFGD